ncbi:flagellar biosynthesis/type III secretory pathway chaperone [Paenibacillus shirakamiensis]|uniref:Flagellar biosynthesis/type III secretory pathway chaperone n=1 Tax=Paenibacillus shirakamiensis TaxID=1265935 RepID=A0ABS4JJ97_9BACL|nr:flagellar protein FlgN [Paenibacillus shirakamiensis]MBP2001780.1 flagellar biosynthesis/type III secretory pathway chaperone [Paenibacillus shirakamiensis]
MAVHQLIEALSQLDQAHANMIELAGEKQTAIMNNDVDGLIGILNQESRTLKRIEQLEDVRLATCYHFLKEKGVKSQLKLTITELSRLVFDPDEKKLLTDMQRQLSDKLQHLKRLNDLNQKLIEQSLTFLEYSLDLLVGAPDEAATYQHPADKPGSVRRPGIFDTRA